MFGGEDASLGRRGLTLARGTGGSLLHIQQLQAASDGALVDTPEELWYDHRLCDVAEHRANRDLIFESVNRNARCLEHASPELKNNPNIVYYAVTRRGPNVCSMRRRN